MPLSEIRKSSMEELARISPENYEDQAKTNITLVLDNIRSLQNVGSIFRTADAFGIAKVYLCGITGTPPNKEIEKSALGATSTVKFEYFSDTKEAIDQLRKESFSIAALEQTNKSILLQDFRPEADKNYAFILGNEVFGVDQLVLEKCDFALEIPQIGSKHSFNVSVSTGILLWDYFSKNILKK